MSPDCTCNHDIGLDPAECPAAKNQAAIEGELAVGKSMIGDDSAGVNVN